MSVQILCINVGIKTSELFVIFHVQPRMQDYVMCAVGTFSSL